MPERARGFALTLLLLFASFAQAETPRVFIYYYAWYANPAVDNYWGHWQESDHRPPFDIASSFYPILGAYSSKDVALIDQHMRWIAGANIQTLIYSWWGRNDFTDKAARTILDAAADYNLRVVFLIEPYPGRTTKSICNDIEYLSDKFGNHPGVLHPSIYFIYDPEFTDEELRVLTESVHNGSHNSKILIQTTDVGFAKRSGADGLFAYEAVQHVADFYRDIVKAAQEKDLLFVPCVSPGFNINRTRGEKQTPFFRARNYGRTYDRSWEQTLAANPDALAIISFNEWHEGTQIEPAANSFLKYRYLSYEGAYGKSGPQAQQSYLRRTAQWIDRFLQMKN